MLSVGRPIGLVLNFVKSLGLVHTFLATEHNISRSVFRFHFSKTEIASIGDCRERGVGDEGLGGVDELTGLDSSSGEDSSAS